MATQLQIRRGTSSQVAAFTGAEGEIVVNTTNDSVHVNDGSTAGGFELARVDGSNWNVTNNISTTGSLTAASLVVDTTTLVVDATNDRVGINIASPSDALHVLDTSGNAYASVARGTQSQGEVGLRLRGGTSGNDWYIYQKTSSNNLNFYNTSDRMTLDASGNLGLGTTIPSTLLHLGGTAPGDSIIRQDSTVSGTNWEIGEREAGKWQIFEDDSDSIVATFMSSGNVGIGTSSPDSVLEANITTSGSGANNNTAGSSIGIGSSGTTQPILGMRWTGASHVGISGSAFSTQIVNDTVNSNAFEMYTTGASPLVLGTGAAERMRISASGYVNPKANVAFTNAPDTQGLHFGWNYSNGAGESLIVFNRGAGTTGGLTFVDNSSGGTHDEIMRLEGGNLLIGSSSSSATSGEGSKFVSNGRLFQVSSYSTSAQESLAMYSTGVSAYRFYVDWGGTVHATSTSISAISDQRLKENIRDLDAGLDEVLALKPRKFDWKEGKGANTKDARGFIAQEFEEVFPDLIDEWKDPAPEGEEPYKSVRQDLIPVLVKAIQEQQAQIEALQSEINLLKGE